MKIFQHSILSFLLISIFLQDISGGTILSSNGVGSPVSFSSARSMGMGTVSIAISDPISASSLNPAQFHRISTTRLYVQYFYEKNNYSDEENNTVSDYANFDGFNFVLPFGSGIGISAGLFPITRVDYNLSFQKNLVGETFTKSVKGQGGLNNFKLSLFFKIRHNFTLGLTGHYLFGKTKETWKVIYDNITFTPTSDIISLKTWGYGFTFGIAYSPLKSISLGGIISPKTNLETNTDIFYTFNPVSISHRGSITFPSSWGLGAAYHIGQIGLMGVDFFQQNWPELKVNDMEIEGIRKSYRIAFGGEILPDQNPFVSYFKRIAYRLGFFYQPYFLLDPGGNTITEMYATIGLGFPLLMNMSRIDVALSFGKRGSLEINEISENLFRLSIGVSVGEKWFIKY